MTEGESHSIQTDRPPRLVPCCPAEGTGVTERAGSQTVRGAELCRRRSHSGSSEPATKGRTEIKVSDHERSKSLTSRFTNFETRTGVPNTQPASLFYMACLVVEEMFKFKMFLWVWRLCRWTVGYSIHQQVQRY